MSNLKEQERKALEDAGEPEPIGYYNPQTEYDLLSGGLVFISGAKTNGYTEPLYRRGVSAEAAQAPASGEVEPVITNEMKAECIGKFSFMLDVPCGECLVEGGDEDCEVCGGELTHQQAVTVPWDICKKIYKRMARLALAHPPAKVPEGWKLVPLQITAGQLTAAWHNHALNIEEADTIYQSFLVNAPEAPATPTPATTPEAEWVKCEDRLPKLGQRVQLFSQGVIQHHMPVFDQDDDGLFWDFEIQDNNPPVDFERDQWRELPAPPTAQEGE
ncbi:DUF551 domain-containing protein [Marinobacter sp.]|uniref:DUF551 domain-containing protein n=1 Tax=Marinobacter sp. TaxID=50741 RepID=UPI0035C6ECE9